MSDRTEANKAESNKPESTVPYFGKILDELASAAFASGHVERFDNAVRQATGSKDGILPSVEFVNPKGEKETQTPFRVNGIQYEIDDSPSDPAHLYRVDYDGRRDAIEPGEAARARAAFEEMKGKK